MIQIRSRSFLGGALAVMLSTLLVCGCGRKAPQPPPAARAPLRPEIPGLKAYQDGRAALAADDQEEAQRLLREAIHLNTNLTEAWFELGHLEVTTAPALAKSDELKAMVLFREGLEFEQQARNLLDEGKTTVWTPPEAEEARAKMEVDLRDSDHALADGESLREALRLRVY